MALTACSDRRTKQGGQNSITNRVATYQYAIPDSVKTQIDQNAEKIIITELVSDSSAMDYAVIVNVASYINSVNDVMTEQGYTISSSDTNSIGDYGNAIVVTLIFENTKN